MAAAENSTRSGAGPEPRGFGEHTRGLSGEYAHEQGWGLDEAERTRISFQPRDAEGSTDYDHRGHDFGEERNAKRVRTEADRQEVAARHALGIDFTEGKES